MTLVSTLSRPRWGMPSTISSTPRCAAVRITVSMAAIALSAPSSEKRLDPGYLTLRKRSNPSDRQISENTRFFSSGPSSASPRVPSNLRWIQAFSSGLWMCMNSTPMVPQ